MKLNVLLAKTEKSASSYKEILKGYLAFFKGHQDQFKGVLRTYTPREGTIDEPSKRGNKVVVTTVEEKLQWLEETAAEYINSLFAVEATNAGSFAKAKLEVDGVYFGELSSLELLRLKSLLEGDNLEDVYKNIPVRPENELWDKTTNEQYMERDVYESKMQEGVSKSILKENYILPDPNIQYLKNDSKYTPQLGTKDTIIELGNYTVQHFTGEYSHRERAEIIRRRSKLLLAVIEALKVANEQEIIESALTAKKIFGYLHRGEL